MSNQSDLNHVSIIRERRKQIPRNWVKQTNTPENPKPLNKFERRLVALKDAAYAANAAWQKACADAGIDEESPESDNLPEALIADDAWDAYEKAQKEHRAFLQRQKEQKRRHYQWKKENEWKKKRGSDESDINLFTTFAPTFEINGEEKVSSPKELPEQKWLHGYEDNLYHQDPMYYPDSGSNVPTLTRQEKFDMLIRDGLTPSEAEAYMKLFRRYPRRG